ncbi:U32 family peptidase [Candidatus Peregrinibacteria bacterium]|nr:U32 family peptidase [Candidatus Peregrinibacteria bacterium]
MEKAEILAPVGSFESLKAAIDAGCDSIYFGVKQLNMRARRAHNFSLDELKEVASICKKHQIKSYITLNTLLYDHDLPLMRRIVDEAVSAGIDAIICQDVSAIQYANEKGLHVHASTQLSISNIESVKFYSQFADTIVLAREVDLKMMEEVCRAIKEERISGPSGNLIRIEVFVHGALCIAQAGRCQMSLLQSNTSAQRGACLHECRKKYRIIDDETDKELILENQYVMSPKDLCTLPFLDKIIKSGVAVLKIEGRGRSPQYVNTVVKVYKEARDAVLNNNFDQDKVKKWIEELKTVYNRGFCDGYYLGKPLPEWSKVSGNVSTDERLYAGLVNHYFPKAGIAEIQIQANEMRKGDRFVVMGKTTGVKFATADSIMIDEKFVETSGKPSMITVPVSEKVRKNDKVYILKKREQHEGA